MARGLGAADAPSGVQGQSFVGVKGAKPLGAKWIWRFDIAKICLSSEKFLKQTVLLMTNQLFYLFSTSIEAESFEI